MYSQGMILALAPMKDITDLAFIKTLNDLNTLPDYFITEYFRTVPHHKKLDPYILQSITKNPTNKPVWGQLVGTDAPSLVRDALKLLQNGAAGVDLNMGCPAPLVCRKNAGGGMLRTLHEMDQVLGQLRDALPEGKFSVKCRIGFEYPEEFERIIPIIAKHTPDRLCIHARTVKEGYRSSVHPKWVAFAKTIYSGEIIANGNIVDTETAQSWINIAQPHGLMIGRAALRNPWIFNQIREMISGEKITSHKLSDLLIYIERLLENIKPLQDPLIEEKLIHRIKKYLVYTVRGLDPQLDYYMKRSKTEKDFLNVCKEFLNNDEDFPILPPEDTHLFAHFGSLLCD